MKSEYRNYLLFILFLTLAPVLRELFFGLLFHAPELHQPFADIHDLFHTLSEMVFMAILGVILIFITIRFSRKKHEEIRVTQAVAIEALASLAEYRDAETSAHLQRIRELVGILTQQLMTASPYKEYLLSRKGYTEDLLQAAVLHDIGKIAIPDGILLKPGRLSSDEFEVIKTHTTIGSEILAAADRQFRDRIGTQSYLSLAQSIARSHHEKWDGSGYPDQLCGTEIPLASRIVALCDVYDAVTSERVYKRAWTHGEALELIQEQRGRHFDPVIADAFLSVEQQFKAVKISNPHFS